MNNINIDGEYYGNFDTYYKIKGDDMEVSCYLEATDQILKFKYKRHGDLFINIEKENDTFEIFAISEKYIILFDHSEIPIEIKKYTFMHKLMQFFGYKI